MSIRQAAIAKTIKAAMFEYLEAGFSVIPLNGKQAVTSWTVQQIQRPSSQDIICWENKGWLKGNVGIVCGKVSGNLIVIDLDGERAEREFKANFPGLMQTFTVRTGSGGLHVYLEVDDLPNNRKFSLGSGHNGLEIRGNGQYVVAPPSIHPTTKKSYQIASEREIKRIYNLTAVETWLDGLEPAKPPIPALRRPEKPNIGFSGDKPKLRGRDGKLHEIKYPRAYASSALADEAQRVSRLAHGTRNTGLHQAAVRMAQLVNYGWLSEGDVEHALTGAARRWSGSEQTEAEIIKTIRSGIEDGRNPPQGDWRK